MRCFCCNHGHHPNTHPSSFSHQQLKPSNTHQPPSYIPSKMQFLTIASLFAAAVVAAPAPQTADCPNPAHCSSPPNPAHYENVDISGLTIRKNDNGIQNASFKLSGQDGTDIPCEIGAVPSLPSEVVTCGTSDYRFGLTKGKSTEFGLAIYHETGASAGKYAIGDAPTYCRAGGDGPDDFVCQQTGALTIVIVDQNFGKDQ